jgi:hypothetical protein
MIRLLAVVFIMSAPISAAENQDDTGLHFKVLEMVGACATRHQLIDDGTGVCGTAEEGGSMMMDLYVIGSPFMPDAWKHYPVLAIGGPILGPIGLAADIVMFIPNEFVHAIKSGRTKKENKTTLDGEGAATR